MQIVSNIALISINETLIVQLLSFLVFLYLINRIMFRPLREVMRERNSKIEKIKLDIIDAQKELTHLNQQMKDNEKKAKSAAFDMAGKLEEAGAKEAEQIHSATGAEINAIRKQQEALIKDQLVEARRQVEAESESLALLIVEKVLDRRLA